MVDLAGKLKVFEPISVLQMLNLAQATGELTLEIEDNIATVFFDRGNVTFAAVTQRPTKLGEYLVREGYLTQAQLESVLKEKGPRKKLGVLLVESGVIEEEVLHRAITEQIKEVIYEVVRWRDGGFKFRNGNKPKAQDITIDIPLDHLMLEGLKRMDEEGEGV